ncbi:vancomycin high temperature exclusion protein [Flavobacterium sp. I3-2]|uniref:SanA/YdcF family protein n=1 Tax=Flavobacterium sp. I3-2 TaxID=2748319 RepID=UPI00293BAF0D|nr:ElyC/SanA/YdcF family protein [Flavobacterium sp. I3-2]
MKYIIASGDNSVEGYNEPEEMKLELIERGIPEEHIFLDFAGFRTLDSVVRTNEIFSQDDIIIISQKFHNQRTIYIADKYGIEAFGFNAKDVNTVTISKTQVREYFARLKVFLDILRRTEPKFKGDKIKIE